MMSAVRPNSLNLVQSPERIRGRARRIFHHNLQRRYVSPPPPLPRVVELDKVSPGAPVEIPMLWLDHDIQSLERKVNKCVERCVIMQQTMEEVTKEMEIWRNLLKVKLMQDKIESNCGVCFAELCDMDIAMLTKCCHVYHVVCLNTWLSTSLSCPYCRTVTSFEDMRRVSCEEAKLIESLSTKDKQFLISKLCSV